MESNPMSLTLSRKENQSIVIFTADNEQMHITVTSIDKNQVKINFDAPDGIDICRDELREYEDEIDKLSVSAH